jgi:hypothetical protein
MNDLRHEILSGLRRKFVVPRAIIIQVDRRDLLARDRLCFSFSSRNSKSFVVAESTISSSSSEAGPLRRRSAIVSVYNAGLKSMVTYERTADGIRVSKYVGIDILGRE